jgi:hypothetical protein
MCDRGQVGIGRAPNPSVVTRRVERLLCQPQLAVFLGAQVICRMLLLCATDAIVLDLTIAVQICEC